MEMEAPMASSRSATECFSLICLASSLIVYYQVQLDLDKLRPHFGLSP